MTKFDEGKFDGEKQLPQNTAVVSDEQVQAILAMNPCYANKFYSFVNDGNVRLIFAEESSDKKYTVMRASIVMSVQSFMTMMNMLGPQAQQIQMAFQNHQKASELRSIDRSPNKESLN